MVVLKIFNVDKNDNEKPLCTLQAGEHVLGRGSFANCVDKKISRKHIMINVRDVEATLTLVHITPIFYMSSRTPNIQILKKDESIILSDGDKFAFLMEFWYTIKIENDQHELENTARCSASTILISNPKSSNTVVVTSSSKEVTESAKRNSDDMYSEERKKLKLMNESLDRLKNNIDLIVAQDSIKNEDAVESKDAVKSKDCKSKDSDKSNDTGKSNTTDVYRTINISDSDEEDSDAELLPDVTQDIEIVSSVKNKSEENSEPGNKDEHANKSNSEILDDLNKEPMIQNEEEPTLVLEPQQVKEEPTNDKENINDDAAASTAEVNEQNDGETEQNQPDVSASSSGASNTVRREQCWYGENCYRKNANHKSQFSHPGDSDYSRNSDDGKNPCPYGALCYRTNTQHRKDYDHPRPCPAPKPSTNNRSKRRTNVDIQSGDESDSQGEDDAFSANESSSTSEVFESGDSDSDYMEDPDLDEMEDSEEVRVMFKEAKKFLRKKRND